MSGDEARAAATALEARGELRAAAEAWDRARQPLDAARARLRAGDAAAAIEGLARTPRDLPGYRERCVLAVELALQAGNLSLGLENMLAEFVRTGPQDDVTAEAFDRLAELYVRHRLPANAREVLSKLVRFAPAHPGAAERLAALPPLVAAHLDDLPELPLAEPLPTAPTPSVAGWDEQDGPPLREGATVGGRYRLDKRIGSGSTSVVFRATDEELGDTIAVKVLTRAVYDPETDARLQRELMLSRQLLHPNIVRAFEMGRSHGFRYMTMELLEGEPLTARLRRPGLSLDEGLGYLIQACAGLQAAHDLGVIHRDVKPANCFIVNGGVVKLMDFGIAKVRDAPGLTETGFIAGTPGCMAPEQATNFSAVTPAVDIYALGIVAYNMFTGRLPFEYEDAFRVIEAHRNEVPKPPRALNLELPESLQRVILRCLEKNPHDRFATCRELGGRFGAVRSAVRGG